MSALPVKECTQGDEVNIRTKEMQEILEDDVIPSIFYGLRLALRDSDSHAQ